MPTESDGHGRVLEFDQAGPTAERPSTVGWSPMTATDVDSERASDDGRSSAVEVFRSERLEVVCG